MPALNRRRSEAGRQQKITFGEMRASGVRGLLIYCSDYKCSHSTAISGDRWPDHVRLATVRKRKLPSGLIRWCASYTDGAGIRRKNQFARKSEGRSLACGNLSRR
jgi:hypothetical protein